jgi:hypothetical protein
VTGEVTSHPLAAWLEDAFGLTEEEGRFVRRMPVTFSHGIDVLHRETGVDREWCERSLKAVLEAGNATTTESGEPLFAFRLHQWLASGRSVFATLQHSQIAYSPPRGSMSPRRREAAALSPDLLPGVRAGILPGLAPIWPYRSR